MKSPEIKEKDYININGVGSQQLTHHHFEIWQKYFKEYYKIKKKIKKILFLPCAAIKPYYNSPIHRIFNKAIDRYNNIQKFVISNAGIIPYEFCDRYPFESYDWNPLYENESIKLEYIEVISKRLFDFFHARKINNNVKFISYLRNDSESLKSLELAFNKLNFNLQVIEITGKLHESADTDLLLTLEENLIKLEEKLKSVK